MSTKTERLKLAITRFHELANEFRSLRLSGHNSLSHILNNSVGVLHVVGGLTIAGGDATCVHLAWAFSDLDEKLCINFEYLVINYLEEIVT